MKIYKILRFRHDFEFIFGTSGEGDLKWRHEFMIKESKQYYDD